MDKLIYLNTSMDYKREELYSIEEAQEKVYTTRDLLPNKVEILELEATYVSTIIIGTNHKLYGKGLNITGCLGLGDMKIRKDIVEIPLPEGVIPYKISIGDIHTLMLSTKKELYAWGGNYSGQLGTGDAQYRLTPTLIKLPNNVKPVEIKAGKFHSLALGDDGNMYAWGMDHNGDELQTGIQGDKLTPTLVKLQNKYERRNLI